MSDERVSDVSGNISTWVDVRIEDPDLSKFEFFFEGDSLGQETDRARIMYRLYGPNLRRSVINVLLFARDEGRVSVVLDRMQTHFTSHLQFQHPEIRGTVVNSLGTNETEAFLRDICEVTLGLTPADDSE